MEFSFISRNSRYRQFLILFPNQYTVKSESTSFVCRTALPQPRTKRWKRLQHLTFKWPRL